MALAIIRLKTSPIPIDCTSGFLSSGISLQATKAVSSLGSDSCVHKLHTTAAKQLYKLTKAHPKDEHTLHQE